MTTPEVASKIMKSMKAQMSPATLEIYIKHVTLLVSQLLMAIV